MSDSIARQIWQTAFFGMIASLFSIAPGRAQLLINEIEYDQTGPDTAEFIELFEPERSGLSLVGWQLILYNGTGSERRPYETVNLSGVPNGVMPADGYLVVGTSPGVANVDIQRPANWIQNGSPDGMALVHNGVVIELLAYEGSFVGNEDGNGGPAAGMEFEDLGIEDDAGYEITIQRSPDGGAWTDTPEAAATPGRRNPNGPALLAIPGLVLMHRGDSDSGAISLCASGGVPPLVFVVTSLPAHGQLFHASGAISTFPTQIAGELRYVPGAGYSGLDTFGFRVRDAVTTISNSVTEEIAVQAGGVVISEVMYAPSGDQRVFEHVEIHNAGGSAVALGRMDASATGAVDTTDNLYGRTIAPGQTLIVAKDAVDLGFNADVFRCEWNIREQDIARIPIANYESLFSAPNADCAVSEGSRLLLFNEPGDMLDAVDLGLSGLPAMSGGQSLTIDDTLLQGGPLNTRNNDPAAPWRLAGETGVPGVRIAQSGDVGGPMVVPGRSSVFTPGDCFGRCCLSGGNCNELTEAACASAGGDIGGWSAGSYCGVGQDDIDSITDCLGGPVSGYGPSCGPWDRAPDGHVDVLDFAAIQAEFGESPCP